MKLEGLKVSFNAKAENGNSVNVEFDIGSLELTPEEHEAEMRLMEKLLPTINSMLNGIVEDMTAADNKKQQE